MESIEQMIKRLCPKGVKYVKIEDVCTVGTGSGNRQDASKDGLYPFFVRSKEVLLNDNYEFDEEAILIPGEGGIGDIFHYYKGKYALHQRTYRIHPTSDSINTKYLYYYMYANFKKFILRKAVSATVTSIRKPMIETFEIALPPLEIQNRIVEVLDKMTTLTAELEAELEERKQQYEYYRNKLLTFNDISGGGIRQVVWKKISEIGTVMRGTSFQKKHFTDEGTPCIHYGQIYTKYAHHVYKTISFVGEEISRSPRRAKTGALVMATTSENIDDVGKSVVWLGEEDIIVSNDACFIQHNLNPKYLGYLLQTESFSNYKKKVATGTKVIRINADAVADFVIPVPSLEEQARIVSILDRFEVLSTDLQSGLPAEIEARRQQYEYYRNKLLTFEQSA